MKIAIIYFSATENTSKIAKFIKEILDSLEMNNKINLIDITVNNNREKIKDVIKYDAIIFGFPIYASRAPNLIRKWLKNIDGDGKKCSVFFTYGGVTSGIANYDIKQILDKQSFILISTATFLAKHTYNLGGWKLMEDHPNQGDFKIARDYIIKTFKRFKNDDIGYVNFEKPKISEESLGKIEIMTKKMINPPSRQGNECSLCRICEELCPVNAMNADIGEADFENCIRCFRCYINCPENALIIQDLKKLFLLLPNKNKLTEEILEKKVSRFFL